MLQGGPSGVVLPEVSRYGSTPERKSLRTEVFENGHIHQRTSSRKGGPQMPAYTVDQIRNVALMGHSSSGKTTLADQMLFLCGETTRAGSVEERTSILDVDELAREHQHSLDTALCHMTFQERMINLFDTPGYPDLAGPAIACLEAVETVIIAVNAHNGVESNTRRMFEHAKEMGLGLAFVINKMDTDYEHLQDVLEALQETFGPEVLPLNLPADGGRRVIDCFNSERGKTDIGDVHKAHLALLDAAIESDETLLERYLAGDQVNANELESAMDQAIVTEHVVPVMFTDAKTGVGVQELLEVIAHFFPNPKQGKHRMLIHRDGSVADQEEELVPDQEGNHFIAQVVRVGADPKSNMRYNVFRVFTGSLRADQSFNVNHSNRQLKAAHMFKLQGATHEPVDEAIQGDILAIPKLELKIGDVLHDDSEDVHIRMPRFPTPMFSQAIVPRSRGDEAKLAEALHTLADRDPCLQVDRDEETQETLLRGCGDMHLRLTLERMQRIFKLNVDTHAPRIAYRETITAPAEGHYRHKKQSGGAGQFGEVWLSIEPMEPDDPEWPMGWKWGVVGGSISRGYEPAVRKGCEELLAEGVLAGYVLEGIRVTINDGKEHPVDSKEIAFKTAGKLALKQAILAAEPIVLEPIVLLTVNCPLDSLGAITGDLAVRRGRPLGQDNLPGGMLEVKAQVPLVELQNYGNTLSGLTGGQGTYEIEFSSYEPTPPHVADPLIKAFANGEKGDS